MAQEYSARLVSDEAMKKPGAAATWRRTAQSAELLAATRICPAGVAIELLPQAGQSVGSFLQLRKRSLELSSAG
jgi:hypothetical protein